MKKIISLLLLFTIFHSAYSQLEVLKMIGKNSKQNKLGYGLFGNYDIPLNDVGNKSLMIELLDIAFFPGKGIDDVQYYKIARGYISVKIGYRKIFSEDSKTGFFIEPQVGYCRVVFVDDRLPDATYGDGVGAALEGGYSLEVGQNGNAVLFGLKYENDIAAGGHKLQSIGFRISYSFSFLRRNRG